MKKQYKVSIPKPCHEDWSAMTPKEKGRFCGSCSKTVVDFTKKSKEEIQEYLGENFGKRVCGHFNRKQLDTITLEIPSGIFHQQLSFQKLFILALLFVMGTTLFSCQYSDGKKQKIEDVIVIDSLEKEIESQIEEIDSLQTDAFIKKLSEGSNNDGYLILGAVPMTNLNGTILNKSPLPPLYDKNFHLDSIIEIEEEEIILEDVPIIETLNLIEGEIDLTTIGDVDSSFEEIEEEDFVYGVIIEKHPKFPETKDIPREKAREDFNQRMKLFFQEHFKAPQGSLGLKSGKYATVLEFKIDETGKVSNIKIKAPHGAFKKETERVLKKLPIFIPGKQRGKVVKTKYTLPIRIDIE